MDYYKIILNCINSYEKDEPIFIDDVRNYVMKFYDDKEKNFKKINYVLRKLKEEDIIRRVYKGIYYVPETNIFGEVPLAKRKIIHHKYLIDKLGNVNGYITGAALFNKVGLTTLVPNITDICTNECKSSKYKNEFLNILVRKPKIKITNYNYKYLQLFDIIENKERIGIQVENKDEIIYRFIQRNDLNFENILKYAKEAKCENIIDELRKKNINDAINS